MIEELMKSRRSIRSFKPEHPGKACIEKLIEMATTAPSASNKQPWRFFVADEKSTIERMAREVEESVTQISAHVEEENRGAFLAYGDYFVRFREAPVVIVPVFREMAVLSHLVGNAIEPDQKEQIRTMEFYSGIVSTSLAIQNLLLYTHSLGLGSSCMTGPLVALRRLKEILGIPRTWEIAALIPVGFPNETPVPTTRKESEQVIRWVDGEKNHPGETS